VAVHPFNHPKPWDDPSFRSNPRAAPTALKRGVCGLTGLPVDTFFPVGRAGKKRDALVATARSHCADCRVNFDCYQWAIKTGQTFGIWGGVDFERVDIRGTPGRRFDMKERTA
jgi:WhiB family transcriptional regulator, redox-sensing transcriptional regulator